MCLNIAPIYSHRNTSTQKVLEDYPVIRSTVMSRSHPLAGFHIMLLFHIMYRKHVNRLVNIYDQDRFRVIAIAVKQNANFQTIKRPCTRLRDTVFSIGEATSQIS